MGLAVGLSGDAHVCGPADRREAAASLARIGIAEGGEDRSFKGGDFKISELPYIPSFIFDTPIGGGI
jgi:hypothetical protein